MELATITESALSPQGLVGHASYVLLIASMLMTRMVWLRAIAVAAGSFSIAYSVMIDDWVSCFWEVLFVAVNVVQLAILAYRNRRHHFSDDDWLFRSQIAPDLDPSLARRLLGTGAWGEAEQGFVLTEYGRMASHLYFLADGEVRITVDGVEVGCCYPGSLIGEISVLSGTPATATATALTKVRYLALERTKLRALIAREREVEQAIDQSFRREFRGKIASANESLVDAERRVADALSRKRRPPPRSGSEAAPG